MKDINELNLSNKKYIIFDLDGTLINSIGIWNKADQILISKYSKSNPDMDTIQKERDDVIRNNANEDIYLEYCRYILKKYNLDCKDEYEILNERRKISNLMLEREVDFKPNAVKLISKLKKRGFTLVLATVTTRHQLNTYCNNNKNIYEKLNFNEVFDLIVSKEDVRCKKPNPEIYEKILSHYKTTPDKCLVFEDSYTGVLAAKNAKIEVINIFDQYSEHERENINKITDYFIKDYKEIIDYLEKGEKHE